MTNAILSMIKKLVNLTKLYLGIIELILEGREEPGQPYELREMLLELPQLKSLTLSTWLLEKLPQNSPPFAKITEVARSTSLNMITHNCILQLRDV